MTGTAVESTSSSPYYFAECALEGNPRAASGLRACNDFQPQRSNQL
ncbi:MAG: hypothetical protein JSU73_09395 [candidate division WOR-3 bacterium]|nr:MAG: hypothetical protein JSU73_09395 [candidate division WOR-3 bacterium]